MATLLQDIQTQGTWLVKAFKADGLKLDYSIASFEHLDRFYDIHVKNGEAVPHGRFDQLGGKLIFSIGAYIGETLIRLVPGSQWQTDDSDAEGEINASVQFPDGTMVWPMQRALKRYKLGPVEGIYGYGVSLVPASAHIKKGKPWWKFW